MKDKDLLELLTELYLVIKEQDEKLNKIIARMENEYGEG